MIDIYKVGVTPEEIRSALIDLYKDFEAHNHDGNNSRKFETLQAETVSARAFSIRKTSYSDSTSGVWMGLVGSTTKVKIGSATKYLDWDGSALNIVGSITGSTITGGTFQTATSGQRVVIEASDNTLRFYDSVGQVIGIGSTSATAIRVDLNATTTKGVAVVSATANTVGYSFDNSANVVSTGMSIQLTGATNGGTGIRIDHDGNGGEGIFIQNTGAARGIFLEMSGTVQGIYITQSSTGLGLEIIKSGTGIVASFESSNANLSTSAVYMTSNSADSNASVLDLYRSTSHSVLKIRASSGDTNRQYGIHFNLANSSSGIECAFRFEGSEYIAGATAVATITGVVAVYPDAEGAVCYIPVYSSYS